MRHRGCTAARAFAGIASVRRREGRRGREREEEEGWTLGSRSYLTLDRNRRFRKSILDAVVLYDDINCRAGDVFKLSCRVNCI